jgi:hypothetical protein
MKLDKAISFEASLKSLDTENWLDKKFYRPIGFRFAMLLRNTPITPNFVTIFSIFVGVGAGLFFYPQNPLINLIGIVLLIFANILDCVDGQLARITGIKSKVGRILDGLCGEIWFLTFYIVLSLRLMNSTNIGAWVFLIAFLSAFSHFTQASVLDYYKTFHLHMLKGGRNSELETSKDILKRAHSFSWKNDPSYKLFLMMYYVYTLNQEKRTPQLQRYIAHLKTDFPNGIPEQEIVRFRTESLKMMPLLDCFTFNSRSIILFISLLLNIEWLYFFCEIVVLNPLLLFAIRRHEKMLVRLYQ